MTEQTKIDRIIQFFAEKGTPIEIITFQKSTRTAEEAADAVGCQVAQIVKSLVLRNGETPLLFLVSGVNRLNLDALRPQFGQQLKMADADFTRAHTGFSIGGVPPAGHEKPILTYLDETLMQFETVWAAAGTPNTVFKIKSFELQCHTGASIIRVT